ncbi:MAG TPA: twin-arginine translocase subunit TatC [Dehalococcoidia bacterium]|nr:twin-arginine translocase subunit TatC [Dehalococcoidia bacterium]
MTAQAPPIASGEKVLTLIEHLRELRHRVMISVIAVVLGVLVSIWPLTKYVFHQLVRPAEQQVPGFKLHQFQLLDYWSTYFRVSLMLGVAIAMPVIIYQVLAFIAPGLTRTERRWLYSFIGGGSAMFLLGMAFAYFVALPRMLDFLLKPGTADVQPTISVTAYVDTVTRIILMSGLVFETPLFIMALAKVGVVTSRRLLKVWRYAVVLSVIVASFMAPSWNPLTPIIVGIPIFGLYALGVVLARLVEGGAMLRHPPPGDSS